MVIYAVFEDGIEKDEWLLMDSFTDADNAKQYAENLAEDGEGSDYCVMEFAFTGNKTEYKQPMIEDKTATSEEIIAFVDHCPLDSVDKNGFCAKYCLFSGECLFWWTGDNSGLKGDKQMKEVYIVYADGKIQFIFKSSYYAQKCCEAFHEKYIPAVYMPYRLDDCIYKED